MQSPFAHLEKRDDSRHRIDLLQDQNEIIIIECLLQNLAHVSFQLMVNFHAKGFYVPLGLAFTYLIPPCSYLLSENSHTDLSDGAGLRKL